MNNLANQAIDTVTKASQAIVTAKTDNASTASEPEFNHTLYFIMMGIAFLLVISSFIVESRQNKNSVISQSSAPGKTENEDARLDI